MQLLTFDFEDDYSLIGIHSTEEDYRLAYLLNKHLGTKLSRFKHNLDFQDSEAEFPLFEFKVAGETGIDITAKGNNKSQILDDFDSSDVIYFFGDKCDKGGNDHEIALAVHDRGGENSTYQVNSWEDTFSYLQAVKNML